MAETRGFNILHSQHSERKPSKKENSSGLENCDGVETHKGTIQSPRDDDDDNEAQNSSEYTLGQNGSFKGADEQQQLRLKLTESIYSQIDKSAGRPPQSLHGEKGLKESIMDYSYCARV